MINWFNMPAEGLSNGGQFEIKELTATENKTYEKDGEVYNKVTVNVSGGGSSDFKKVNVTLKVNEDRTAEFNVSFANPETGDVNGVYVTTEDNVRYISGNAIEIYLGGENAEEKTFEAYSYLNNPIYALWRSAHSVDDYTITGDAEISTFTEQGHTFYVVTISGDCTISVEGSR